jgi:voltage-gated hydrogen channel 1
LGYTLLTSESCAEGGGVHQDPKWLEILSHLSLVITTLFLVEIPLQLWAFGIRYFDPFQFAGSSENEGANGTEYETRGDARGTRKVKVTYSGLHLFDAVVVVTTFVLEVVLKGKERELAGLLILLRLWRLVKLVGGESFVISFLRIYTVEVWLTRVFFFFSF